MQRTDGDELPLINSAGVVHINITHNHTTRPSAALPTTSHICSHHNPHDKQTSQLEAAALPPPAPFVSGHGICRIESDAKAADGIISPVSYAESADLPPVRRISVS